MENRARNTFVLLTIVLGIALQCISAEDAKTTDALPTGSPASVTPAAVNPAHVDLSAAHAENAAKTVPQNSETPMTNNNSSTQHINIEVYYEALCKDSVEFVSKQLLPVYNKLNKFINVTFIPFAQGNITLNTTDNTYNLTCRRDGECAADKVHACGINKIKDSEKLIKFVNCSLTEGFNSPNKTVPIEVCGKNSSIDNSIVTEITECANSKDAWSTWLQNYKNMSTSANVTSVPKILINKVPTEDITSNNLMKVVCKQINEKDLPADCNTFVSGSDKLAVGVLPILIGAFYIIKMI
ncbi:GILT-like protein 1 [Rhopalosiphum maidis]|uniref:GILT-like protein 1 n=1 Tax=Rhopalosiphum maidis TaxID=43146 RepID=UPI000EFF785F|nr:GILT-like protein 1 [Rhopalosiphum maidis]